MPDPILQDTPLLAQMGQDSFFWGKADDKKTKGLVFKFGGDTWRILFWRCWSTIFPNYNQQINLERPPGFQALSIIHLKWRFYRGSCGVWNLQKHVLFGLPPYLQFSQFLNDVL
jgi:hypothetical protein